MEISYITSDKIINGCIYNTESIEDVDLELDVLEELFKIQDSIEFDKSLCKLIITILYHEEPVLYAVFDESGNIYTTLLEENSKIDIDEFESYVDFKIKKFIIKLSKGKLNSMYSVEVSG